MRSWRAFAALLVLAAVVFGASFAIGRALRAEPSSEPPTPPPVVDASPPTLVELGAPARVPALRPLPPRARARPSR